MISFPLVAVRTMLFTDGIACSISISLKRVLQCKKD